MYNLNSNKGEQNEECQGTPSEQGTLSLWEIVTATDGITAFIATFRLIKRTKILIRLLTFTCIQKLL